jgi:hypothetical protein
LLGLKFFPDNSERYDFEPAFGVIEFKFHTHQHAVRVFAHKCDEAMDMMILHVMSKKRDRLSMATKARVEGRLARLEFYRKILQERKSVKKKSLYVIEGGSDE